MAGIDEAGYGPMLGPLVVACAAARSRRPLAPDALRRLPGLTVCDSKRLAPTPARLGRLAATALPFLGRPARWSELLARCVLNGRALREHPWYGEDLALPEVPPPPGRWRWRVRVVIVEPREFNAAIAAGANKAEVLFAATARLLRDLPGPARVFADAQGMRRSYRPLLERHFTPRVRALEERRGRWRYRVGRLRIQFRVHGESAHDLTALASIVAKYVRELCMERVNRFWRRRCGLELPLVRASGYHNGPTRRFTEQLIRPVLAEISEDDVVRLR